MLLFRRRGEEHHLLVDRFPVFQGGPHQDRVAQRDGKPVPQDLVAAFQGLDRAAEPEDLRIVAVQGGHVGDQDDEEHRQQHRHHDGQRVLPDAPG